MGLKREISLLAGEKGLKDLDHMIDVCLVGIHSLKSFLQGVCWLNVSRRLCDALYNAINHLSDDG